MPLSPTGSNRTLPDEENELIIQCQDGDFPHIWWDVNTIFGAHTAETLANLRKRFPNRRYRMIRRTITETLIEE